MCLLIYIFTVDEKIVFFYESRMNFLWNVFMEQFQRRVKDAWFAYVIRH